MEPGSCPDSWIDQLDDGNGSERKAYGDSTAVNELSSRTAALNVEAPAFVPGKNIFARAFVPSFTQPVQPPTHVDAVPANSSSK